MGGIYEVRRRDGLRCPDIYPSFIKIGSVIQKLIRGNSQTHRHHGYRINLLSFFQNKESRLKIIYNIYKTEAKGPMATGL
jgi:hypothetical protein